MAKYRVLLVDDHAVVRSGIRNAIESLPSIVVEGEAEDGLSLMTALEQLMPDILLIDVTMPNFEPISAIHKIHSLYPQMKILVISAYDDDVYVHGLLGAGVDGYHMKDQPLQDLSLAIQRIINGERWISSSLVDKLVSSQPTSDDIPSLTSRQREILVLLQKGWNNQKIAYELGLSIKTIENHLTRIYRCLDVQSRLEAVNFLNENPQILNPKTNSSPAPLNEPVASTSKANILLVDDNPRFRYHLRRTINNIFHKLTIDEVGTVEEAIQAVSTSEYQIIFIDVILGNQNGINCVKKIKSHIKDTRVILISAYPDKEFHRLGLKAGAAAFIDKKMLDTETIKQIINDSLQTIR